MQLATTPRFQGLRLPQRASTSVLLVATPPQDHLFALSALLALTSLALAQVLALCVTWAPIPLSWVQVQLAPASAVLLVATLLPDQPFVRPVPLAPSPLHLAQVPVRCVPVAPTPQPWELLHAQPVPQAAILWLEAVSAPLMVLSLLLG